jgi:hypothetical protein
MKLTRLMRAALAVARSSRVATQVEVQEPQGWAGRVFRLKNESDGMR